MIINHDCIKCVQCSGYQYRILAQKCLFGAFKFTVCKRFNEEHNVLLFMSRMTLIYTDYNMFIIVTIIFHLFHVMD